MALVPEPILTGAAGALRSQVTCHYPEADVATPMPSVRVEVQATAADILEPLCRLATNKGSRSVEGKWRLLAAILLCTLFMVWHASTPRLLQRLIEALDAAERQHCSPADVKGLL